MSYSKTTWKTGDTITAQLLNHAEDGIAANDEAIAAIPAGLQLYGPYYATGTGTVTANGEENVNCNSIEDVNGISVTLPEPSENALTLVTTARISGSNLIVQGFTAPYVYTGQSGLVWAYGAIAVSNPQESEASVTCDMAFYSNVELPPLA